MRHLGGRFAVALVLLTGVPVVAWGQSADDNREQTEKVREVLDPLQAEPGERIADVGAGEGFYTLRIARAVGANGRVTAVDVSEKYLEKLRERALRCPGWRLGHTGLERNGTSRMARSVPSSRASCFWRRWTEV